LNFKNLAIKYSQCIPNSLKVGSLGPSFYNAITKKEGSIFKIRFLQFKRHKPNVNELYSETDYLITSGTFISKLVFNDVGFFDDKLFIDLIDTEWCLRAKHKGYQNFILPRLKLHHNLGEYGLSFFGEIYPIHPPLRMYYYFRNSIYLYKKKSISLNWKIVDCFRNIFRFLFYIVLVKPRLEYVKMSTLGIYHGIINRMGECKR
jgi:rhamnosyltransferase